MSDIQVDLRLPAEAFVIRQDPDIWKAKTWGSDSIRVVESVVGPYGAIDQMTGTVYFDVGDVVVKFSPRHYVVVPRALFMELFMEDDDESGIE